MKRIRLGILALALGLCTTPGLGAQAQPTEGIRFGVGGGLTLPMGNYADFDKAGWHVMGLIQFPISQSPVHARFDAMSGRPLRCRRRQRCMTGATGGLHHHLGSARLVRRMCWEA
jgi:hypothetical protein